MRNIKPEKSAMGLWGAIKKGAKKVADGAKKVANTVSEVVNKAADAVADVVETIGNAASDGLSWLGDRTPVIGDALKWLGGLIAAVGDLASSIIKAAGAVLGGALSGVIKVLFGVLTLDGSLILEGLMDVVHGVVGGTALVLLKTVALGQVMIGVGRPRPLNEEERRLISLVFLRSIATYNVRVVDDMGGALSWLNERPFVAGNTIYMKGRTAEKEPALFVHECVHVWQNQHAGSRYASEAVVSQEWGVGYDWATEAEANKAWIDFEREAQAELIEDVFDLGQTRSGAAGNGVFFAEDNPGMRLFMPDKVDWTQLANEATATLRGRLPWRISLAWTDQPVRRTVVS
jgi:hypothetical protein